MKSKNEIAKVEPLENVFTQSQIDTNRRGWTGSLTEGQRKFVNTVLIGLGVTGIGVLAFWLAKRQVQKIQSKNEQNKSFGSDRHATWAKQFKQAFDNDGWWGTDVPLVRQTMRAIPSKEDFKKVQESYKRMYKGANLIYRMSDELTKMEYQEMLAIKNAKPEKLAEGTKPPKINDPYGWARRINSAVNYTWLGFMSGTDEEAIKAVFQEIPTQRAFYHTAVAYRKLYGVSIYADLDGDLDWSLDWKAIIKKKPTK